MIRKVLENEIDLIEWLLPFLNEKGTEKYIFILNQLLIIKTFNLWSWI